MIQAAAAWFTSSRFGLACFFVALFLVLVSHVPSVAPNERQQLRLHHYHAAMTQRRIENNSTTNSLLCRDTPVLDREKLEIVECDNGLDGGCVVSKSGIT